MKLSDWRIDTSAGGPILVYKNCSVIESEDAEYVLGLIKKDLEPDTPVDRSLLCRIDAALMRAMDHSGKNVMVKTEDLQELRRLAEAGQSLEFYRSRCNQLQKVQSTFRDPERQTVCNILANGTPKP